MDASSVPPDVYDRLPASAGTEWASTSRDLAIDALSDALLALAKSPR